MQRLEYRAGTGFDFAFRLDADPAVPALPQLTERAEARAVVGQWPAYRVSATHVMTMSHRIYDCFWQMRLPHHRFRVVVATPFTVVVVRMRRPSPS